MVCLIVEMGDMKISVSTVLLILYLTSHENVDGSEQSFSGVVRLAALLSERRSLLASCWFPFPENSASLEDAVSLLSSLSSCPCKALLSLFVFLSCSGRCTSTAAADSDRWDG